MPASAKLIIEVTAGLLPPEIQWGDDPDEIAKRLGTLGDDAVFPASGFTRNRPEPQFTRRYAVDSEEWHAADDIGKAELLATRAGAAQGYAGWLMLQPDRFNHVRVDWIWL